MLEELNKKAKKVGLHVADAKKADRYSIRKVKNGKLVAKNIGADEAQKIIKKYRDKAKENSAKEGSGKDK